MSYAYDAKHTHTHCGMVLTIPKEKPNQDISFYSPVNNNSHRMSLLISQYLERKREREKEIRKNCHHEIDPNVDGQTYNLVLIKMHFKTQMFRESIELTFTREMNDTI